MGFLLKIVIFAVAAYGIWKTAQRLFHLFGGGQKPPAPQRNPPPQNPPQPEPRRVVVEDTRLCTACGAYVSTTAAKCGRSDCPQAA